MTTRQQVIEWLIEYSEELEAKYEADPDTPLEKWDEVEQCNTLIEYLEMK